MTENSISIKRFGGILALLGLVLSLAGLSILVKNGSHYFVVIGALICLSGILMALRQISGVYVLLATVILIVAWSLVEVNFNLNLILPRITVPILLLVYVLRPAFRLQFNAHSQQENEPAKRNDSKTLILSAVIMVLLAAYFVYTQWVKSSSYLSTKEITVKQQILGIWRDVDMLVFVEIKADGSAYQCRIAQDQSVIVAAGNMVSSNIIRWGKVFSWESDGTLTDFYQEAPDFKTWGDEKITLNDHEIFLTSDQGNFRQVAVEKMHPICRYHEI